MDAALMDPVRDTTVALNQANDRHLARDEIRKWIDFICTRKGWNGSELARRSGLVPSTVLRMKNKQDYSFLPSYSTIRAISLGSGVKIPDTLLQAMGCGQNGEPVREAVPTYANAETMPVKPLSCFPAGIQFPVKQVSKTERPARLRGVNAFAFRLDDHALEPLIPHGSMMYAVEREPVSGDLAVVTRTNGQSIVRLVDSVDDDGMAVINPKGAKIWIERSNIRSMGVVVINERL